jgi:molybdopterin converting factor small subunit
MIKVKLTGQFIKLAPEGSEKGQFNVEFEPGMTLSMLFTRLGVDGGNVKFTTLVNNERKPSDYVLEDSDSITIMPLLAGG